MAAHFCLFDIHTGYILDSLANIGRGLTFKFGLRHDRNACRRFAGVLFVARSRNNGFIKCLV